MFNFVSAQQAMVLYLEDPSVTCARARTYVNSKVAKGGRAIFNSASWPSGTILANRCVTLTYSPEYDDTSQTPQAPNGLVSLFLSYRIMGESEYKTKRVTLPPTGFIAVSLFELLGDASKSVNKVNYIFYNDTDQALRLQYATYGRVLAYTRSTGLVSASYGDRMGNDELYPDFGVCRAHGEARVKDKGGVLRKLCVSPSLYGVENGFERSDCRVEFFLGNVLDGTFELDGLVYSNDEIYVTFRLKSPMLRLDNYVTGGPMVVYENTPLTTYIQKYVDFATNDVGIPMGMYDFNSLSSYSPWQSVVVGFPLLGNEITVSSFLDYVGQLTCSSIAIRNQIGIGMRYGFDVLKWFNLGNTPTHYGTTYGPKYDPSNILSTLQYNPIKGNYIDKLTYTPYEVTLDVGTVSETTVFPITTLREYTSVESDLEGYLSYWGDISGITSDYLGSVYGTQYPRPNGNSGDVADLVYDQQRGWGVHAKALENMMKRSLTRGFLWRFQIVTDYSNVNQKTSVSSAYLATLQNARTQARFMSSQPSSFTEGLLLSPRGSDLSGTNATFNVTFGAKRASDNVETYHELSVRPIGRVKRTVYTSANLINPKDTHSLYASVAGGRYISTSTTIAIRVYVSYWFTSIFGGGYALADAVTAASQTGQTRLNTLRNAMRKVSPQNVSVGGPGNRLYQKTWESSGATKMSEYIRVEETSEQYYCYPHPWTSEVMRPCNFMLWTSFGDDDYRTISGTGFSFKNAPALDYSDTTLSTYLYRVGLWKGADASQAYAINDVSGKSGQGFNTRSAYLQSAWGYRVFWQDQSENGVLWYHTGDDSSARGGYLQISTYNVTYQGVTFDSDGKALVSVSLPSAEAAKQTIMASNDNFLGQGTYEGDHPGRGRVDDANAWMTFWNPAYAYSVYTRSSLPQYETNPIGVSELENLDESAGSKITWLTGRPIYGYVLKDIKVETVATNCYSVTQLEPRVLQVGKSNKYNYTMETNPLMFNTTYNGTDVIEWAIGQISSAFADGRYVVRFKCKACALQRFPTGSSQGTLVNRPPRLGDVVPVTDLTVIKDGFPAQPLPNVTSYFVRGVEVVNEGGELYYNMELMQK